MKIFAFLLSIAITSSAFAHSQALNQLIYEIRDPKTDAFHFRQAVEKIGEYLAVDILEELETEQLTVKTLTGCEATHALRNETPVLVTILRGGLLVNAGVHKIFPDAEIGFIAMARNEATLVAKTDYIALPEIKGKTVIITDTMLATGGSVIDAIKIIEKHHPKRIFVAAAMAAKPGIERILNYNPSIKIFAGIVDPVLNDHGYIIPGLGDAGDRAYGNKVVHN